MKAALGIAIWLGTSSAALAASPVTINNAANTDSVAVIGHALSVTSTGSGPSGSTIVSPQDYNSADASTTVVAGGTFQTALAANTGRHGCLIQNPTTATEPLYVSIATSSTLNNSYSLNPGGTFSCSQGVIVTDDAVKVTATTTGHAFTVSSQ